MATMGDDEWRNVRILEHYAESHIAYSLVGVKIEDGKTYYYQAGHGPLHHAQHLTDRLRPTGPVRLKGEPLGCARLMRSRAAKRKGAPSCAPSHFKVPGCTLRDQSSRLRCRY